MALPLFPQEENSIDKLSRSLGTGLGNGIQTLAQSNLERMLGRNNYFQQNLGEALKGLESKPQPSIGNLIAQQPIAQKQQAPVQEAPRKLLTPNEIKNEELALKRAKQDIDTSKEARNWVNEYRTKAQEANTLRSNFKLMGEAARSPDIFAGMGQRLAERFGFKELTTNNASQIFDKLASEVRVHLAKVALPKGSRITNLIEQLVGKTVASREMDKPAMIALSDAGEKLMELADLEYQEADKKLSEWGGKVPYNADNQVDKALEKRKKEIRKEAEKILYRGVKGEIPEKQSEFSEKSYSDISKIPQLSSDEGVWSKRLNRFLTDEELRSMGYGR